MTTDAKPKDSSRTKTQQRALIALFEQRSDAERAITRLIESGVQSEHIGYLQPIDIGDERNGAKGAAEGIAAGATSGAITGRIIAGAVIGLVPGVGLAPSCRRWMAGRILVSVEVENEEGGASSVLRDSAALEVDSL